MIEIDSTYQWIVAAMLLLTRELNIWIQTSTAYKAAGTKDMSGEIISSLEVDFQHCLFLLTELGTEITNMAAWVIVLSDLTLNFYLAVKIIWMKNKGDFDTKIKEVESMLVSLLLNEFVDAVVPLTFCSCLLLLRLGDRMCQQHQYRLYRAQHVGK